ARGGPARLHDRDLARPARRRADRAGGGGGGGVLARAPRGGWRARASPRSGQGQLRPARKLPSAPAHARDAALRGRPAPRPAVSVPRRRASAASGGRAPRRRRRLTETPRALEAGLAGRFAQTSEEHTSELQSLAE